MAQIVKLTLVLTLLFTAYLFAAGALKEGVETGIYYAALGFGSLIFPFFVLVFVYHWLVSRRFNYSNLLLRFGARTGFITAVSLV
ncbi:MAG: hypothetical protein EOP49_33825, partial [Sphingobacteriales bacterium]